MHYGSMIHIDDIVVELNGRTVLEDLSLMVAAKEKVVISGESGSGKTTLLRTLIGRHLPTKGQIAISKKPMVPEKLAAIRKLLYYLPQEITPLGGETVLDFLKMPFSLSVNRPNRFDADKCNALFEKLRLRSHVMAAKLGELSGGERKRVGLVQALLLDRPILLLDELTSSVDAENRGKLVDVVLSLNQTTVLAIAHDTSFIERVKRHVVLKAGRIEEPGG